MRKDITYSLVRKLKPAEKPYEVRDRNLIGFIVRVQPSGYAAYIVEYGRGRRKTLGNIHVLTVSQARGAARAVLASVTLGGDPQARQGTPTLAAYLRDDYGPWCLANRKSGHLMLRRLQACFLEEFGDKRLTDVLPVDVERWRTSRLKAGIRPATVNRDLAALKAMLSKAVDTGYLPDAPLRRVKLAKVDTKGPARYLAHKEETRLRSVLDNQLKPLVLVALNTGLRRGELFALTWADVDFGTKTLTVQGRHAKSGATRHLPLNSEALGTLRKWKAQGNGTGPVFPGASISSFQKSWISVLAEAGIAAFRFHDLRHTFASNLVMAGVDLNTVRELLGHADISMTLRYAHLAPEHKRAAVEKLVRR